MVYAPSHTQSGYIHNLRVSLANRWPLALLSYWCTAPIPSALIKAPLKDSVLTMWQARPVCKYIPCDILPWVTNSVYTQGDKTQEYWKLATDYSVTVSMPNWPARTTQESSCHSTKYTENNISLTSLTLPRLGVSRSTRENTENTRGACMDDLSYLTHLRNLQTSEYHKLKGNLYP